MVLRCPVAKQLPPVNMTQEGEHSCHSALSMVLSSPVMRGHVAGTAGVLQRSLMTTVGYPFPNYSSINGPNETVFCNVISTQLGNCRREMLGPSVVALHVACLIWHPHDEPH